MLVPVILEKLPSLADGVRFEPVQVQPGTPVVDASGARVKLGEGVQFYPSGCQESACVQTYAGVEPASLDQMVVQFKLRPGLKWSDGAPLTAADSAYSYQVAQALFPKARAALVSHTQSYAALDETTVEWRGILGYRDPRYASFFFTPLPEHAWDGIAPGDLAVAEQVFRSPVGWGPYQIDEWVSGDHISLSRNPNYFRASEGLPHFDHLVFRFMPNGNEALNGLLAGECDYVDETAGLEAHRLQLADLSAKGQISLHTARSSAWEHIDFGIVSAQPVDGASQPAILQFFRLKETRQSIAECIDRGRIQAELSLDESAQADLYLPNDDPLANPDARRYIFDPQAASQRLQSIGWLDDDNNPETPRVTMGVSGVPDGTAFEFNYLVEDNAEERKLAQIVQDSLAQCGIKANLTPVAQETLFAPGPDGPLFGRSFSMAQYSWQVGMQPSCFLYTTNEIPGVYPQFPNGWGGANAGGYSNPEFDRACQAANTSLPDLPGYRDAHFQAQAIYAEDLPSIPLYWRQKVIATRPDLCEIVVDAGSESALWNLEQFVDGELCKK